MAKFSPKTFDVYTPEQAKFEAMGGEDIMKKYLHMRKVANERIRKLSLAGYGDDRIYSDNKNRFPMKREIVDSSMLYDAIAEVSHFLAEKRSTVSGIHDQAAQSIATFESHYGEEGLTGLSWKAFGEMMRSIKGHAKAKAYYSGWKSAYRHALSRADKLGMSAAELSAKIASGEYQVGPRGGVRRVPGKRA